MPAVSVIVPTHNRQQYARHAVRTLLESFSDIEVVVSDTSDDGSLQQEIGVEEAPGRYVYSRPTGVKNAVANYEHGRSVATGDYLVFIGDDDSIGLHICEIARWAKQEGIEAVSCSLPASYGWPDFRSAVYGSGYSSTLSIREYSGEARHVDALFTLREASWNLGAGPLRMPRAYLGMISRELSERIVTKYGSLFGGVSPDVYSACLIAAESRKTVSLDYPFILPGSSGASTSGLAALRKHDGELWSSPHIRAFPDLIWHPLIPEFYSVETVWSFSLISALEKVESGSTLPSFARLYVKCLLLQPRYWKATLRAFTRWTEQRTASSAGILITRAILDEAWSQTQRVFRRIRNPKATGDGLAIHGVETISAAFGVLARIVTERVDGLPSFMKSNRAES